MITIIVLLILAGTSIGILMGDNGIITRAQEAKEMTETAEIEEQLNLAQLSAKIKTTGGAITVNDYLAELAKAGVDYDAEEGTDGTTIIINGNYVYEIEETDGEIKWNYSGTESNPKPSVKIIEANYEENTIKVKVSTKRNDRGSLTFYIKEEGEVEYIEKETILPTTSECEYIFQGIEDTKIYQIKVVAIAENGEKAENTIETASVPELTSTNVILNYTVNGSTISETEWTKGPKTVTISTSNIDISGYTIETSKDNETYEEKTSQTYNENGTLYVRLKDSTTGQKGKTYSKEITHIDTTKPIITGTTVTTKSITITEATDENGSGIVGYAVTEDTTEPTEFTECTKTLTLNNVTVEGLTQNTTYYVWVKDEVGNVSNYRQEETKGVPALTEGAELEQPNITFTYTTEQSSEELTSGSWTNENVIVTANIDKEKVQTDGFTLQYTTEATTGENGTQKPINWENYPDSGVTVTENKKIYFRLFDNATSDKNGGVYATANVTQIDNLVPQDFIIEQENATTSKITVSVSAEDAEETSASGKSGIKEYRFSKDNGANWSAPSPGGTYEFNDLIGNVAGDTYRIKVEAKDNAGNTKVVEKDCNTIRKELFYCYDIGTDLATVGTRWYKKASDGPAICAVVSIHRSYFPSPDFHTVPILLSTDKSACHIIDEYDVRKGQSAHAPADSVIEYHGVSFYMSYPWHWMTGGTCSNSAYPILTDLDNPIECPDEATWVQKCAEVILDAYFYGE